MAMLKGVDEQRILPARLSVTSDSEDHANKLYESGLRAQCRTKTAQPHMFGIFEPEHTMILYTETRGVFSTMQRGHR